MLSFKKELYYTGYEKRKSKKTGKEYTILNFLGEDGNSFNAMYRGQEGFNFSELKQLDLVAVEFVLGQYNRDLSLSVLEIVI